jgi:hypothetical protein
VPDASFFAVLQISVIFTKMFVISFTIRRSVLAFLFVAALFHEKDILAAKKIAAQLEFFLALLYPSGYNSKWKGFEPQNFSAFVPQHGIFSRWPRAAACTTTACRKIENVKL